MPAAALPENRVAQLADALNQLLSSPKSKDLENLLMKAKKQDVGAAGGAERQVFPLLVQIVKLLLKRNTVTAKMAIALGVFFKQVSDVVSEEMVEQALQRCYLDADALESAKMDAVAANFAELVKALDTLQVIHHVPSREAAEAQAQAPAESAVESEKPEKSEKPAEKAEKPAEKPIKDEAKFLELLKSRAMGDELNEMVAQAGLENDTRRGGGEA